MPLCMQALRPEELGERGGCGESGTEFPKLFAWERFAFVQTTGCEW